MNYYKVVVEQERELVSSWIQMWSWQTRYQIHGLTQANRGRLFILANPQEARHFSVNGKRVWMFTVEPVGRVVRQWAYGSSSFTEEVNQFWERVFKYGSKTRPRNSSFYWHEFEDIEVYGVRALYLLHPVLFAEMVDDRSNPGGLWRYPELADFRRIGYTEDEYADWKNHQDRYCTEAGALAHTPA